MNALIHNKTSFELVNYKLFILFLAILLLSDHSMFTHILK